ncbi:hypothetical protein MKK68_02220 [Methylobacterium sp. E-016]|uniref:hypothetical protein n=1 Tax=Methylobacterium sp. E-016 TaxID=2836556 RepID=UPI001FBB496E|nr:hypothetical protein [Methylobacterium sp. E-016]MCJ2074477.1 hypothetical protein [Methylobacterium sp. E-016]
MPDDYDPASIRVLAGLPKGRRRPEGFISYEPGSPLDLLLTAHAAGWPDPPAAVALAERALGGEPWTEASLSDRVVAAGLTCEHGITMACRGEPTGTPLDAAALEWLEAALDDLAERLGTG